MSEDRELLELAAKAAGIELTYRHGSDTHYYDDPDTGREQWYPLGIKSQAFSLAAKLMMKVDFFGSGAEAQCPMKARKLEFGYRDSEAAACRAITRAAAEIGRAMP